MLDGLLDSLLNALALPKFGLPTVFVVSFISATLVPLGSEPAVFGFVKLNPDMLWPTVLVATAGNTLGGIVDYWVGYGAKKMVAPDKGAKLKALQWVEKFGPKAMLLSWLPAVGDPLCSVAGWLKMPFWPSIFYMAIGKFLRYAIYTPLLLWVFPGQWAH
jgi:membrane protein YqaA with SNARE-associated domain